jgi:predicted NAD/FAD-binding protein
VGGGIAGLTCAHFLQDGADVHLFEADSRLGGHVHAVTIAGPSGPQAVETGFLAFHRSRYPTLSRLLGEFGIATAPSPVGLTVWDRPAGRCFRAGDLAELHGAGLAAEIRQNLADLLGRLYRPHPGSEPANDTLQAYCQARGYHADATDFVIVPSIAALWGFQPRDILAMSARTVLESLGRFLGVAEADPFERVVPDSGTWIAKLTAALRAEVNLGVRVEAVGDGRIRVDGQWQDFDAVVLATHADDALDLLESPEAAQRRLLGAIPYRAVRATVHLDGSLVPDDRAHTAYCWLAGEPALTTWNMAIIQDLPRDRPIFVTIGPPDFAPVSAEFERARVFYRHPAMPPAAIAAATELDSLNDEGATYFCGSYFGITGSNECAIASAERVSRQILRLPRA